VAAPSPPPIEAVLFDLDDTLLPFQTVARWQWAWRPQGPVLSERHVHSALRHSLHAWDRRRWAGIAKREPPVDWAAYRHHLEATLNAVAARPLPEAEVGMVVDRFLKPAGELERYPDAISTIQALLQGGYKVGVATPVPEEVARPFLRKVGIPEVPLLPLPGTPEVPGLPALSAYRQAAKALGASRERTAFVGDLYWSDYRASARAGLAAFLLERPGSETRGEARRIASLVELPAALKAPVAVPEPKVDTPEPAG
jgi:FMN phosphatase YigB (HAD superfamily)